MEFAQTQEVAEFSASVRAFLAEHLTDEMRREMHRTGTIHHWGLHRQMAEKGWLSAATPGSASARDTSEMAALFRELELVDAPYHGLSTTMMIVGIIDHLGSPELKQKVLPPILAGQTLAALGYSEPDSGSDVFAARTRAVPVDDEHTAWRINGQKMWTTLAQESGHCLLLTRTNPEKPKHLGLTMFVVPLDSPGITIQPIHTMAGERTNTVFYEDVEVQDFYRIGEVDGGNQVMSYALSLERGVMGGTAMIEPLVREAIAWARTPGPDGNRPDDDPSILEVIARARIDAEVAWLLTVRTAAVGESGASPALAGNVSKLFATVAYQRAAGALQEASGVAGMLHHDSDGVLAAAADGEFERTVRHAPVTSIQGGTTEIQRNHIAQHGLGLPRVKAAPARKV
ncbi:MAG: acyl-CoA dehydrogenase protein [Mycobacterium sp.]|nr:acyl-CoA dehydrogenase protein [Mycobacterium sp.]